MFKGPQACCWFALFVVTLIACGPSEAEIQERVDRAVEDRLASTTLAGSDTTTTDIPTTSTSDVMSDSTVGDVYDMLRTWELTLSGGLPRGELNSQWPGVSAQIERRLEEVPTSARTEDLASLEAARLAWQECHAAANDVLTASSDHRTSEGRILLLRRQIADLLYEHVVCVDGFLAMDEARTVLGMEVLYADEIPPTVTDDVPVDSAVGLAPYGLSVGDGFVVPFGYPADRTIYMLSSWLGPAATDSGWNRADDSVRCIRPLAEGSTTVTNHRVVSWPGLTAHFVRDPDVPIETTDVDHFSGYVAWYVPGIANPAEVNYEGLLLETPEGASIASSLADVRAAYSEDARTGRVSVSEANAIFVVYDLFPFEEEILYWGRLGPFLDQVETIGSGQTCSPPEG